MQSLDAERCGPLIKNLTSVDPILANIGAVDLEGRLLCLAATPTAPLHNYKDAPWFAGAVAHATDAHWYLSAPYYGDVSRKYLVNIVAPLNDVSGRRIGLIAAALDLGYLSHTILTTANMAPKSVVGLVDARGRFIAREPALEQFVGKPVAAGVMRAGRAGKRGRIRGRRSQRRADDGRRGQPGALRSSCRSGIVQRRHRGPQRGMNSSAAHWPHSWPRPSGS